MKSALLFSASQSQPRFPTSQPIFYLLILLALFSQELEKKYVFERLFVILLLWWEFLNQSVTYKTIWLTIQNQTK